MPFGWDIDPFNGPGEIKMWFGRQKQHRVVQRQWEGVQDARVMDQLPPYPGAGKIPRVRLFLEF
jgi:hypothetical protein